MWHIKYETGHHYINAYTLSLINHLRTNQVKENLHLCLVAPLIMSYCHENNKSK